MYFCHLGIDILENQVKEAKEMVEESDIKYDEVARKLAMVIYFVIRFEHVIKSNFKFKFVEKNRRTNNSNF